MGLGVKQYPPSLCTGEKARRFGRILKILLQPDQRDRIQVSPHRKRKIAYIKAFSIVSCINLTMNFGKQLLTGLFFRLRRSVRFEKNPIKYS